MDIVLEAVERPQEIEPEIMPEIKKEYEGEEYYFKSEVLEKFNKQIDNELKQIDVQLSELLSFALFFDQESLKETYVSIKTLESDEVKEEIDKYNKMNEREKKKYVQIINNVFNKTTYEDLIDREDDLEKDIDMALLRLRVIFSQSKTFELNNKIYKSLDGFLNDTQVQKKIDTSYELTTVSERLKKFKNTDIPKIKNVLIKEIENKAISQKKVWFKALVSYIMEGDFRKEIIMPLVILVIGLLGTDSIQVILKKLGIKITDSDIDKLGENIEHYTKNISDSLEKLNLELKNKSKYFNKDNLKKYYNYDVRKLLGHRVRL